MVINIKEIILSTTNNTNNTSDTSGMDGMDGMDGIEESLLRTIVKAKKVLFGSNKKTPSYLPPEKLELDSTIKNLDTNKMDFFNDIRNDIRPKRERNLDV